MNIYIIKKAFNYFSNFLFYKYFEGFIKGPIYILCFLIKNYLILNQHPFVKM